MVDANDMATAPSGDWRTIGHEFAVRQLQGAIRQDRVAHAYLFTGPEQVGKRTLAMDLARALCCVGQRESGRDVLTPCGRCTACDRVERLAHPDVRLLNANTPTSADTDDKAVANRVLIPIGLISDLQADAMLEPYESEHRIFIIDGANLMTPEAANSLLKTLEEPQPAVRLLLTAPSQGQLPATIVSRCHAISLRSVPVETIREALVSRLGASSEQARDLAALSGGNPGWAVAAFHDPSLVDSARQSASRIVTTLRSGLEPRFEYARNMAEEFRRDKQNGFQEVTRWTQIVRDLAFVKHGMAEKVPAIHDHALLEELAEVMSDEDIGRLLNAAEDTRNALRSNVMPQLAFETMMLNAPMPGASAR